ncbi:MAG: glucose-6-phosphate isomerase, partial [Treponemataceae bacterium]|nr:glucose-6-phosphate isomerase [Treponemataceae bacterium]
MDSISWENLDKLDAFAKLRTLKGADTGVSLKDALKGEDGARRVAAYQVPMAAGLTYNYAAKQVNEQVLDVLAQLAKEAQLVEKFEATYNGAVVNTGEKRLVLHHLPRGQLGKDLIA